MALALIAGGAVGNLIDRVRLGYVTDFVHVYWRGYQWPDFNVADSAITVGIVLLLVDAVRPEPEGAPRRNRRGKPWRVDRTCYDRDGPSARSMGISLKGEHLKRYKDIAALFMKYGRRTS